ncbi:hypothetical protein HPT27_11795 [Permianibacter sp. IMCC34836]|uniref:hypothetical protein n=1 Tax=Permianibacter fluminis TaxID=2738515 RepID=UPI001554966D|nr:hypothetical protein [Permianibacter fluminis]NQD37709.1 hypothetical protein [Permianibacter fluminis]
MSLAPVSLSQPGRANSLNRLPSPPRADSPAPTATASPSNIPTAETAPSASDLNRELQSQKENSLVYQLMRQLLIQESHGESESFTLETDTLDISLARSSVGSTSLAVDDNSLSFAWSQTDTFAATITGEGFSISIAGVRVQSMQLDLERTVNQSDPLQIDLSGDGFETTGFSWSVRFDITGDGNTENVSVAADDDAVLALDQNQNGRIDSGKELFGEQNGRRNGFAELRRYDENHDQRIDAGDRIFSSLKLLRWQHDGSQMLQSLNDAGISSISLQERSTDQLSDQGDRISADAAVKFADGRERRIADLWYRHMAEA